MWDPSQYPSAISADERTPVALSIAGSDSSGGAGLQADLKAFGFFGVYGTTAVTAVTAQSPATIAGVEPVSPKMIKQQIETIFTDVSVCAVKTGMLYDRAAVAVVQEMLSRYEPVLVVDPVMKAQSGAELLAGGAVQSLSDKLFARAALITPNIDEAAAITGMRIHGVEDMIAAASQISRRYQTSVLLKGGHNTTAREAEDILVTEDTVWTLRLPWVPARETHGTGCALSAAITAVLAQGGNIMAAVTSGKAYVHGCLKACVRIGPDTYGLHHPSELALAAVQCRRWDGPQS